MSGEEPAASKKKKNFFFANGSLIFLLALAAVVEPLFPPLRRRGEGEAMVLDRKREAERIRES